MKQGFHFRLPSHARRKGAAPWRGGCILEPDGQDAFALAPAFTPSPTGR